MDEVAFADAEIALVAAMAAILLETDSKDALKRVITESVPKAEQTYTDELNRIIRTRNATGQDVELPKGPAVTREIWRGNILKILRVFGEKTVRDFFEAQLAVAKERLAAEPARRRTTEGSRNEGRKAMDMFEVMDKLADFGDDHVGGAKFLKEHFDEIPEPAKSEVYRFVSSRYGELPKDAQTIIAFLAFRCQAGRDEMSANLEKAASKLPDGKLKRDMIG